MSISHSDPASQDEPLGFNSLNTEILIIDEPGDTTVRPPSPAMLKFLLAEREKIARWEAELKRQQAGEQGTDRPTDAPQ